MNINPAPALPYSATTHSLFAVNLLPADTTAPAHRRQTRAISATSSPQNAAQRGGSRSLQTTNPEIAVQKRVIYGSDTVSAPSAGYTLQERKQRIDDYAFRVTMLIEEMPSINQGEMAVRFQNARLFMEPAGYFSGGLLAAGYDPHEKITVTFTSYTGVGKPENLSSTSKRTYFAWEIAAGALEHDKVQRGGPINFNFMEIDPKDQTKVDNLESLGKNLQNHWEHEISKSMRDPSGQLATLSGQAEAYAIRGTLQSLRSDTQSFKKISTEGQEAVARTLDKNGQVIIPNVYGYPLSGYAFIPYTPYDGDYKNRPNQGLMLDLKNGTVREIRGDADFASWAKDNRDNLLRNFNTRDVQGGKDSHWPSAGYVLDTLISGANAHFPGYHNLVSDEEIPASQLFNYTRARGSDYQLKFGNLYNGVADHYQAVNAKNALWSDQTQVFGSSQQDWKSAKDFWGNTFGYVPVIGNTGNIVFGAHDSLYGMTAQDRVGGTAAATISGLQLAHELAFTGAGGEAERVATNFNSSAGQHYHWQYNAETSSYELKRVAKAASGTTTKPSENEPSQHLGPEEGNTLAPEQTLPALPLTDAEKADLKKLKSIKDLPTGGELFSTADTVQILSGEVKDLKHINEKLYTFVDSSKLGQDSRLNILVHGGLDDSTGTSKVSYDGKLHTPKELLDTLHQQGVRPEDFKKVRLLSCNSASGAEKSFAAEFHKLINRPVKGYEGTITANIIPEDITAAINKVETTYLNHLEQSNTNLTPALRQAVKTEAIEYVNNNLTKMFKPIKNNPHWNPLKWWSFKYKPVRFDS